MPAKALIPQLLFTGDAFLEDHAVLVEDGMIRDVLPVSMLPVGIQQDAYPDSLLVPAFIDLQIYGASGKLLAVFPHTDSLHALNQFCNDGGAAFCMPTVATNETSVFLQCIDAVRDYWQQGGKGILGLHIEGPWINKAKRGAHIESLIHAPATDEVRSLLDYGKGVIRIITLAPEVCSQEVIDLILSYGVTIFAGHSNASYEEAMHSFGKGVSAVTHLYNAMSPLQHRMPGLVGAAFDHPSVMASIIADGHHVDFAAIRIAKKIMGDRLFAITDAVTQTSAGYYKHQFAGDKYTAGGILSGSALTMHQAYLNLVSHTGIGQAEALRMCSLYPAQLMNMDDRLGRIREGYEAKLAVISSGSGSATIKMIS